jgi:hypothetical protein
MAFTNLELKESLLGELGLVNKRVEFYQKIIDQLENGYVSDVAAAEAVFQPQLDAANTTIAERDATIVSLQSSITALETQLTDLGETPVTQA